MEAIEGEDSEEYGEKIFDLGSEGVNFKVKVEQQGDYPTYVASRFTTTNKLKLSEDEQKAIYDSSYDLTKVNSIKSYDELKQMIDDHIYVRTDATPATESQPQTRASSTVVEKRPVSQPVAETSVEDDIDELLKDL